MGKFLSSKEGSIALHRMIVARFNFNPYLDFLAGVELNRVIREDMWHSLPSLKSASVVGPANPPDSLRGFVIVADSALSYYRGRCDMVVTDLDGPVEKMESGDFIKVVHAHGDNIEKLGKHVPRMKGLILGTTQSIPVGSIRNIGGFTDGDRSVLMAIIMGARKVEVYGFNFEKPVDEPSRVKLEKMKVARDILNSIKGVEITFRK
ncbi:MAG: hypothetical protein ACP5UO_02250 [Thermoplasmata archaeon]